MATEADVTCPVCQGTPKEPSVVSPCQHQFCLGCIMRWAKRSANCPLCRQDITSIRYSIWSEDDFLEVRVVRHAANQEDSHQDEQWAAVPVPQTAVSGLLPEEWAALFREHPDILGPLRPWLRQQARELFGAAWWDQDVLEANVITWLCRCGLEEVVLVRELQPFLQGHAESFVNQLIDRTVEMCSDEFLEELGLLEPPPASQHQNGPEVDLGDSQEAWEPEDSAEATPGHAASSRDTPLTIVLSSSSSEDSNIEELPSTSSAALHGGPGHPPTAPIPTEQEEPFRELGQAAAEGAAMQGCSHGPSPPGLGRDSSRGGPRRPPKRRSNSSPDSPHPCKRPPPRRL
ncbi:E3 ubiquitin-protein ligase Topors-like [Anser cygnoides]|uniref:E3 ubiquitin-protein ligase Topors-like n=1 Tax=Anser cygnoides TaxID=8845 RepID=UPI0034D300A0